MILSQRSKMTVPRPSDEGRDLCRPLDWVPVESEWERLIRLHRGELEEAHPAAVPAFVYHAWVRPLPRVAIRPLERDVAT